jgi:hypothetical protein
MLSNSQNLFRGTPWRILLLVVAISLTSCSRVQNILEPAPPDPPKDAKLSFPIGLETSDGFTELISTTHGLPAGGSERLVFDKDDKDIATITVIQPSGTLKEKIAEVDIKVEKHKEANIVITVTVDSTKMLKLKTSVMETGAVKEFGPFPVN